MLEKFVRLLSAGLRYEVVDLIKSGYSIVMVTENALLLRWETHFILVEKINGKEVYTQIEERTE